MLTFNERDFLIDIKATNEKHLIYQRILKDINAFLKQSIGKKLYTSKGEKTAYFKTFYYSLDLKSLGSRQSIEVVGKSVYMKFGSDWSKHIADTDIYIGQLCDQYQVLTRTPEYSELIRTVPIYSKKDTKMYIKYLRKLYSIENEIQDAFLRIVTPKAYNKQAKIIANYLSYN